VLDRVYFARGDVAAFDIRHVGTEALQALADEGRGVVLLGAHVGSFEALHTLGSSRPGLHVAMVMYPDNARMIHSVLAAIAPNAQLDVIPIGRPESTLLIRDWLAAGGIAGMLGDRFLGTEPSRTAHVMMPFLGEPAPFSDGPLRLAMLLRQRVVFMAAVYLGGARYEMRFEPLADFTQPAEDAAGRHAQVQGALKAYVARLESICHEAPYNWFNFHDFWNPDGRP
jgi:predicted LPLAT superfamily acyltransferase